MFSSELHVVSCTGNNTLQTSYCGRQTTRTVFFLSLWIIQPPGNGTQTHSHVVPHLTQSSVELYYGSSFPLLRRIYVQLSCVRGWAAQCWWRRAWVAASSWLRFRLKGLSHGLYFRRPSNLGRNLLWHVRDGGVTFVDKLSSKTRPWFAGTKLCF